MKSFALNGISENFSSSVLKFNVHKNLDLNAWTFEKKNAILTSEPQGTMLWLCISKTAPPFFTASKNPSSTTCMFAFSASLIPLDFLATSPGKNKQKYNSLPLIHKQLMQGK